MGRAEAGELVSAENGTVGQAVSERSAGGVVLRRRGRETRVALMRSRYHTWVLPKGHVELEETPVQAAARELEEEVGLTRLELQRELGCTEHEFHVLDTHHRKRVTWFLFLAPETAELQPDPEHGALDAGWFTRAQALRLLSHADQRRMLRRALEE